MHKTVGFVKKRLLIHAIFTVKFTIFTTISQNYPLRLYFS